MSTPPTKEVRNFKFEDFIEKLIAASRRYVKDALLLFFKPFKAGQFEQAQVSGSRIRAYCLLLMLLICYHLFELAFGSLKFEQMNQITWITISRFLKGIQKINLKDFGIVVLLPFLAYVLITEAVIRLCYPSEPSQRRHLYKVLANLFSILVLYKPLKLAIGRIINKIAKLLQWNFDITQTELFNFKSSLLLDISLLIPAAILLLLILMQHKLLGIINLAVSTSIIFILFGVYEHLQIKKEAKPIITRSPSIDIKSVSGNATIPLLLTEEDRKTARMLSEFRFYNNTSDTIFFTDSSLINLHFIVGDKILLLQDSLPYVEVSDFLFKLKLNNLSGIIVPPNSTTVLEVEKVITKANWRYIRSYLKKYPGSDMELVLIVNKKSNKGDVYKSKRRNFSMNFM